MTVDLAQIPFDTIGPNSLLVVRVPREQWHDASQSAEELVHLLRDKVPNSVKLLILAPDTEICHVDEETMNGAGWYRKGKV